METNIHVDLGLLLMVHAEGVGDATYYNVAVGKFSGKDEVYVALGGIYAPTVGGFFLPQNIKAFGGIIEEWAQGNMGVDFFKAATDSGPTSGYYWYMYNRQMNNYPHKWDLVVAHIFAWLYSQGPELAYNEKALKIIGTLNHDDQEETMNILANVIKVWVPF